MAKGESRLLSGRIKTKSGNTLDSKRSTFLSLDNAEPNFGNPDSDRYILASLTNGGRLFLKLNKGFLVSADSVSGDESTFEIDPSGLSNAVGTTLADVLDNLDSAITGATDLALTLALTNPTITDSNFNGSGIVSDPLTLDSDLRIFGITGDSATFTNITSAGTVDFSGATIIDGGTVTTVDINGGTIDGTTIGHTTPDSASFTTISTSGSATLASASVTDLTDNRVVIAGTAGELEDDANLTYDGTSLNVANNTASTNSANGALVVTGGVGIGGALNVGGNVEVNGDFTVTGTTTTVDVETLSITDPLIHLADSNESSDEVDIGFIGHYYDVALGGRQHTGIFRDASNDEYYVFAQYQDSALDSSPRSNVIDRTRPSFVLAPFNAMSVTAETLSGTVSADSITTTNLTAASVDINGGTIDSADITLGVGNTLNVTAGTLTLADNQISGDKIEGGTIGNVTVTNLTSGNVNVDGGFIDGTPIGHNTADSGTFTNLARTSPAGVTAGTYGSTTTVPIVTVDSSGFIDVITTATISNTIQIGETVITVGDEVDNLVLDSATITKLNVTGTATLASVVADGGTIDGQLFVNYSSTSNPAILVTSTDGNSQASPELELYKNSTSANGHYLGQLKFTGENSTGGKKTYAKITGKILDNTNGSEDGIIEVAFQKAGSNNIAARFRSDRLDLINGTALNVNGDIYTDSDLSANNITRRNTTVTAGAYGSVTEIPVVTVDASGFVDSIGQVAISTTMNTAADTGTGSVNLLDSSLAIVGGVGIDTTASGRTITISAATSGVVAGVYGSTTEIPVITVDSYGQVDSVGISSVSFGLADADIDALEFDSATGSLSISTGVATFTTVITLDPYTTNDLVEGDSNKYYTKIRVDSDIGTYVNTAYVQGKIDQSFIDTFDTHDSAAVQGQIDSSATAYTLDFITTKGNTTTNNIEVGTINTLQVNNGNGDDAFSTAVGLDALVSVNSGTLRNTAFGRDALEDNTSGERNTAVGQNALANATTGGYNTAVGQDAMGSGIVTGQSNAAIGATALRLLTAGSFNMAVGRGSLSANTSGSNNVAIGRNALFKNTTGSNNVALGTSALASTTGSAFSRNTAVGYEALKNLSSGQNDNTAIGQGAGRDLITGTENIIIGKDAEASATNMSNEITLGDDGDKSFRIPGSQFYINGGSEGTNGSNVGIGTSTPTSKLHVNGDLTISNLVKFEGDSATVASAATAVIATAATSSFNAIEATIVSENATNGNRQISKVLLTHDTTDTYMNEYAVITTTDSDQFTMDADISGSDFRLKLENVSGNTLYANTSITYL